MVHKATRAHMPRVNMYQELLDMFIAKVNAIA